ncbi:MAG: Putative secreted protein [uncultured Sulfurovum sp.]|uniref:Secreted protein n=1 Tax=uncultured Sulfurovum sp. TaxID=269237 RepID=A0A6S6SPG5_9BACT|nr:MAG: Putative secreted protein [uncultured Sulfurovum sp.]
MNQLNKKLFTSITLFSIILFSTGCAPKNSDGTYNSTYSYHPYLKDKKINTFLSKSSTTPLINNNIEKIAKSLLGIDYKYGANGPYQYDCSSFTKYVFAQQGIKLPRVSRDQAQKGQYIQAKQLQKGDLVFFDSKKSTRISHVGIYLGKGDFIHASSTQDKVTISNLSSNYYAKHFKWGRRVTTMNYAMR